MARAEPRVQPQPHQQPPPREREAPQAPPPAAPYTPPQSPEGLFYYGQKNGHPDLTKGTK